MVDRERAAAILLGGLSVLSDAERLTVLGAVLVVLTIIGVGMVWRR